MVVKTESRLVASWSLELGKGGRGLSLVLWWLGGTGVGMLVDQEKALRPGRMSVFLSDLIRARAGCSAMEDSV